MPQQPPAPAPMAVRVVYHLEPVPRDQQDDELRTRLDTMRAIQGVSSEAAHEVQRAFPTTIECRAESCGSTPCTTASICLICNASWEAASLTGSRDTLRVGSFL